MTNFRLLVRHVGQDCLFTLRWDGERQLSVPVTFPDVLMQRYRDWQRTYLSFYQTLPISLDPPEAGDGLRGKAVGGGSVIATPNDRRMRLVEAKSRLLHDFHQWLRSPELHDIRSEIAKASRADAAVNIFLTCSTDDIARLPWEAWEIGREFAATGSIRIARTPDNIRAAAAVPQSSRRRLRILAIMGDDTGLNFAEDRKAVQSLASLAEIRFVGWQPGADIETLKRDIVAAIAAEQGWDILFFAGHSNEKPGLGGELAIAPNTAIALSELQPHLEKAQQRGLQFALFNSCNGMDIAAALIGLGLNQVAVMREPIHNRVAQLFLPQFLQSLAAYADVHTALIAATEFLKSKAELTYPSADLVPSLFCRPSAPLFQLQPYGWRQRLQKLIPSRREAIAVGLLAALSWQLPVQSWLLERRMVAQAFYRHATQQFTADQVPPVLLVQIDDTSIAKANISDPKVMDRGYLAQIVDQLVSLNAQVIGLDYLLDYPQDNDAQLALSLQAAADRDVDVVFAATPSLNDAWLFALPELAQFEESIHGDIRYRRLGNTYYLKLLSADPTEPQPFSYELTRYHPRHVSQLAPPRSMLISEIGYRLRQMWLHPIVDFSVPPPKSMSGFRRGSCLQLILATKPLNDCNPLSIRLS